MQGITILYILFGLFFPFDFIFCYTIESLFPMQVKLNGPPHHSKCGSVNHCGDTMAGKNWVADRVVEFLQEDPTLCAKE
jgi:hypothetical protein